ncbi:MAG: hypothetical protein M3O41_11885 [Pseudomonadota bacterium]|nr:hypothetical protein [Pseudomonadota bacterium]
MNHSDIASRPRANAVALAMLAMLAVLLAAAVQSTMPGCLHQAGAVWTE